MKFKIIAAREDCADYIIIHFAASSQEEAHQRLEAEKNKPELAWHTFCMIQV